MNLCTCIGLVCLTQQMVEEVMASCVVQLVYHTHRLHFYIYIKKKSSLIPSQHLLRLKS